MATGSYLPTSSPYALRYMGNPEDMSTLERDALQRQAREVAELRRADLQRAQSGFDAELSGITNEAAGDIANTFYEPSMDATRATRADRRSVGEMRPATVSGPQSVQFKDMDLTFEPSTLERESVPFAQSRGAADSAAMKRTAASMRQRPVGTPQDPSTAAAVMGLRRQMALTGAVGGGGAAAQAVTSLIPTAVDRENKRALDRLLRRRSQGRMGMNARQDQLLYREQMAPVRNLATAMGTETERALASGQSQKTAGDIMRARQATQQVVAEQARKAGKTVADAKLERLRREQQDLQERIAQKGLRQQEILGGIGKALGGLGTMTGNIMAYQRMPVPDTTGMAQAGLDVDTQVELLQAVGETPPGQRAGLLTLLMGQPKQRSS
jgi:hypothetical protein